jgi:REP element-mobilizing transposase RayT
MAEYRHSAHATYDLKYYVIWITKYRHKILRGRLADRARDLMRQICQAREVVIIRGAVSPDHIHMLVSAPPHLAPMKLVQYLKGRSSRRLQKSSRSCGNAIGGSTYGPAGTSARRWARWTKRQSKPILKTKSGTRTIRDSRSPRLPSLEPAVSRGCFRRLQPPPDFQSQRNLPALAGSRLREQEVTLLNIFALVGPRIR